MIELVQPLQEQPLNRDADRVDVRLATHLRRNLRNFDISARMGGDDFAVLLPGTRTPDALNVAETANTGSLANIETITGGAGPPTPR